MAGQAGCQRCRPDMDPEAKAVWRRVLREMRHTGVITGADAARPAQLLRGGKPATPRRPRLYAQSAPIVHDRGHLVKNPLHQVVRDNADEVRLLARELGLSPRPGPTSRSRRAPTVPDIDADIGPPPRLRVVGGDG